MLDIECEHAVFNLQGGDGVHRVGAAERVCRALREADVSCLSFSESGLVSGMRKEKQADFCSLHELFECTHRDLYGYSRVWPSGDDEIDIEE